MISGSGLAVGGILLQQCWKTIHPWWIVFIVVTIWNLASPWPLSWWATYWHCYAIIIPLVIGVVTTVWFLWGGIIDLHELYIDLKTYKSDATDDGTVTLAEERVLPDNLINAVDEEAENIIDKIKTDTGKPSN